MRPSGSSGIPFATLILQSEEYAEWFCTAIAAIAATIFPHLRGSSVEVDSSSVLEVAREIDQKRAVALDGVTDPVEADRLTTAICRECMTAYVKRCVADASGRN